MPKKLYKNGLYQSGLTSGRMRAWGFISLEITLGLIVAAVIGFFAIRETYRNSTISSAQLQADQIKQIRDGLGSYALINAVAIVSGSAVPGVAQPLRPTVPELVNLGVLPSQATSLATLNRSPFVTQLTLSPSGCTLGTCTIDGYVYARDPFLAKGDMPASGQYDGTTVGTMMERLGGDGFARVAPNGNLVGAAGSFTFPNSSAFAHPTLTVGSQPYPAGVVGMRISQVTPAAMASNTGNFVAGASCPGGTINNVVAAGTNGNGTGNQCFFSYPTVVLGSSATVTNSQTSTKGSLTVFCLAIDGRSTIQIANLVCTK